MAEMTGTTGEAGRRWHIVQVTAKFERLIEDESPHARQDNFVVRAIKAAGFEVYSARLRKLVTPRANQISASQRRHRHLLARPVIEPLFPRYEFIRFDPLRDNWHGIFGIVGVYGMLCANNLPVAMPDAFVAGLRGREVNGAIPAETPVAELFALDETVRIARDGPFKGSTGQIGKLAEGGRISLLLAMFGGKVPVELTTADIEKV